MGGNTLCGGGSVPDTDLGVLPEGERGSQGKSGSRSRPFFLQKGMKGMQDGRKTNVHRSEHYSSKEIQSGNSLPSLSQFNEPFTREIWDGTNDTTEDQIKHTVFDLYRNKKEKHMEENFLGFKRVQTTYRSRLDLFPGSTFCFLFCHVIITIL